jgi:Mn-dependent DtxR family transcriptional regulator
MVHWLHHRRATVSSIMYGSKDSKRARLAREQQLFDEGAQLTRMGLARAMNVGRGQIEDDLADLESRGYVLDEDDRGVLSRAFGWLRGR